MIGELRQGDVAWVNFNPIVGSEQGGIRPCIVLQGDMLNRHAPTTIVVPLTSQPRQKQYPQDVFVPSRVSTLSKDSVALVNQIRNIDKRRIERVVGNVGGDLMHQLIGALLFCVGRSSP